MDWLDRLTFKTMEKIKDRESLKNGSSHLYLVVDFCSFEHRVVFQVFLMFPPNPLPHAGGEDITLKSNDSVVLFSSFFNYILNADIDP